MVKAGRVICNFFSCSESCVERSQHLIDNTVPDGKCEASDKLIFDLRFRIDLNGLLNS